MVGGIWGQARCLDDRTFGPVNLYKRGSDGPGRLRCRDKGTDTELRRPGFCSGEPEQAPVGRSRPVLAPRYGDRHDVRYIALSQGERESWATGWVGQVVVAITTAGPDFVRSCMN